MPSDRHFEELEEVDIAANGSALAALVSKITPENVHDETDWGPPQGKEIW